MMTSRYLKYILWAVFGLAISFLLLLTAVERVSFSEQHYINSFEKYNIVEATGMDMENLRYTVNQVIKYLRDERDTLDFEAIIHGQKREVFGEREKHHMIDVKDLFMGGRRIRNISLLISPIVLFILIKKDCFWKKNMAKTLKITVLTNIGLLMTLTILMLMDFYKYFTYFHIVFFDNDLWLLDPNKEVLIQMLPEVFFYDSAMRIVLLFVISLGVVGFSSYFMTKRLNQASSRK